MMSNAVVGTQIGLIILIAMHIVVIARWSGRIDSYILNSNQRFDVIEAEIFRLREARHLADGIIQRHEGTLKELNRRQFSRRSSDTDYDRGTDQ